MGPREPGRTPIDALVDTGAVYSVFHVSAADDVGIVLPTIPNQPIQYGSELSFGFRARATIELDGRRWSPFVVFVEKLAFRYSILGRLGVFARFREVSFLERHAPQLVEFRL